MAKVKIPLEMANGVMARNMEEFKANFDLEKVLGHYMSGKLLTWLNDRYYEDEAKQVGILSSDDPELGKKLCEIFGAEYSSDIDPEAIARRNERLAKLRQLTDDDEIIANVDSVAFDQEELAELYDAGVEKIYLGEGSFKIPKSKQELTYVEFAGAKVEGAAKKEELKTEEKPATPCYDKPVFFDIHKNYIGFRQMKEVYTWEGKTYCYKRPEYHFNSQIGIKGHNGELNIDTFEDIKRLKDYNMQQIAFVGKYMFFSYMVGTGRGDYLARYDLENDVIVDIDHHVEVFTIHNGKLYYERSAENYARSSRQLIQSGLAGENKKLLIDFGECTKKVVEIKIVDGIIYWSRKDCSIIGSREKPENFSANLSELEAAANEGPSVEGNKTTSIANTVSEIAKKLF